MYRYITALISLLFIICISSAQAKEENTSPTYVLGSYFIPSLVEDNNSGKLIDLVDEIGKLGNLNLNVQVKPIKRVQKEFSRGKLIGYFPELDENVPDWACKSEVVGYKGIYAFWRSGEKEPKSITDLEGHKVGLVTGYSYGLDILNNSLIEKTEVYTDELNIKMLLAKRIDYIIGDERSTVDAIKKAGKEQEVSWNPKQQITKLPFYFLFQPKGEGRKLCDTFSQIIKSTRSKGGFDSF